MVLNFTVYLKERVKSSISQAPPRSLALHGLRLVLHMVGLSKSDRFMEPCSWLIPSAAHRFNSPPIGRTSLYKAMLLDINESDFTVAVIYGDQKGYKVTRKGSNNWSFVDSEHILVDVFKHRRQLYTVDVYGTVEVWAERGAWPDEDALQVDPHPHHNLVNFRQRKFNCLVETPAGDLIRVKRQSQNKFGLWILDKGTSSFEMTNDIGEFGLFVSHYSSICFPAKDHPNLKANCVYFIDAYNNLCAFNLENGTRSLYNPSKLPVTTLSKMLTPAGASKKNYSHGSFLR